MARYDNEEVRSEIMNGIKDKINPYLTKKERRGLTDLLKDQSIVIRAADKGGLGNEVKDTEKYV